MRVVTPETRMYASRMREAAHGNRPNQREPPSRTCNNQFNQTQPQHITRGIEKPMGPAPRPPGATGPAPRHPGVRGPAPRFPHGLGPAPRPPGSVPPTLRPAGPASTTPRYPLVHGSVPQPSQGGNPRFPSGRTPINVPFRLPMGSPPIQPIQPPPPPSDPCPVNQPSIGNGSLSHGRNNAGRSPGSLPAKPPIDRPKPVVPRVKAIYR